MAAWFFISCYSVFLVATGYLLPVVRQQRLARLLAWSIALVTVVVATLLTSQEPPLRRMIVIVFLQLLSMKIVVAVESYSSGNRLNIFQWLAFSLGWFGMRPALFEKLPSKPRNYICFFLKGVSRIIVGISFLYASMFLDRYSGSLIFYFSKLLLVIGISLILHFGILNLSTGVWRLMGVEVSELFRAPYKSKSLKEFWGRRWNIAFSEMTALIAYRPLKPKIGIEKAITLSFLLSGLLHEIAISIPVKSGYGLPMLYFVVHAVGMRVEGSSGFVQKIISHRIFSHVWVMAMLVLPMPLLFHNNFIQHVLMPLRSGILSALSLSQSF